jgi:hypothetical protein
LGDWREVNASGPRIQAVTASDVRRVAGTYLKKENRAVATYTRKPGTGSDSEDPDLVGLTPEQKPVARQITASIRAEKDLAGLKQQMGKIEAALQSVDPKKQPLQKFILKKVQERVAELEKK